MRRKIGMPGVALACLLSAAVPSVSASVAASVVGGPPRSDGSSGSFDAQFGDGSGYALYGPLTFWNVDTGGVYASQYGTNTLVFTVPYKTIKWNGQTVNTYNFSSMTVEQGLHLTIYGTTPAVFVSQGDISVAGQFVFQNTTIAGGVPSTGDNDAFDGGNGQGKGGGTGGIGRGGQEETPCGPNQFSGSGGGGGGNFSGGSHGLPNYIPTDAGTLPMYGGGAGGRLERSNLLTGGGGGAAGGGGLYGGEYYGGSPGGNGGGAAVFATHGTITLTSTAVLNAAGSAGGGATTVTGGSGGGAGGDLWFFSPKGVSNAGQVLANGGLGSRIRLPKSACSQTPLTNGPDGGSGSGGVVLISAPAIANSGTIDLDGGDGAAGNNGGLLDANGVTINNTGIIVGAKKTE
jgi:hypothetical protein